ncbi:TPA: phage gp6-like head-tail connector protein [Klebsiella aerogenes]|nr:phage gp6-like head-tail connector protein [Klebsiella aerogenes]
MIPSLDEIKAQCRLDDTGEDSLLTMYAEAARERAENYLNRRLYDKEVPEEDENGLVITPAIKLALLLIIGHWYENREGSLIGGMSEIPFGFTGLLRDYRRGPGT